jgi:hypothetical protein
LQEADVAFGDILDMPRLLDLINRHKVNGIRHRTSMTFRAPAPSSAMPRNMTRTRILPMTSTASSGARRVERRAYR